MKEDAFRLWLLNHHCNADGGSLDIRTISSRLSNCRTVERYEGDLDLQFDQDHLCRLLGCMTYSREEERQSRPARHRIPINGNLRNGSATLRSAVSLYKQFRENWVEGTPNIPTTMIREPVRTAPVVKSAKRRTWPTLNQPNTAEVLTLARATTPFVRFLSADVVRAVVEDNEQYREEWTEALQARQIDSAAYLWARSSCAFPGVRRYAGSREIAAHRGHAQLEETQTVNALALDDNDYPKQIWSFVFRGAQFSKFGPSGYALAHLADHKEHGNRYKTDFEVTAAEKSTPPLFGLYTCLSNTVYTPLSLIKPTDFVGTIRSLLIRRAQQLYGEVCQILPPFLRVPGELSAEWNVNGFKWAEPVGSTQHIQSFLAFRRDRMRELIDMKAPNRD
jgi:hypothetical protein